MPLNDEAYRWIERNASEDPARLRLRYAGKTMSFDVNAAVTQIECRRKYARKFSGTLAAFPRFYFPNTLAGEQATSDRLAIWHSSLIDAGDTVADLTAGLGIDAIHLSARAKTVTAVERSGEMSEALRLNAAGLGVGNLTVVCGDCREFAGSALNGSLHFDCVFIDPARRSADGGRVFALTDCEPDVAAMIPTLSRICRRLIVKMSPMLDISHTAGELHPSPTAIIAAGTPTECKELVAVIDFEEAYRSTAPTVIKAVTLTPDGGATDFAFTAAQETAAPAPSYALPDCGEYIYEAWPALMKSGASKLLCERFGLTAFHPNTHIYHSASASDDFPGEIRRITEIIPYSSGNIKRFNRKYSRINVTARNFGISADALRAKLRVTDGGPMRLFAVGAGTTRYLIVTEPRDK